MVDKLTIRCPLCCNETFESHNSLKYHLLSINDNLHCIECSQRFDSILELAEHIGRRCGKDNEVEENNQESCEVINKQIKTEVDKDLDGQINNSILAKALLRNDKDVEKQEVEISGMEVEEECVEQNERNDDEEEECFYCSTCAISFTSVGEHLEKYHEGQEVFVETDEQQEDVEKSFVVMNKDHEDSEEILDEDSNADLLNTLQQEEILDKDGRVYTRKVVQIEKFWNDDQNKKIKDPPLTHKYVVENNKVSKLNDDAPEIEKNTLDIHQCSNCSLNFCKLEQYYRHKCNPKNNSNEHKCNKCNATFQTVRSLSVHMKSHNNEKSDQTDTFVCEFCSTEFPSFKSLRLHSRMHEPVKAKEIEPPAHYGILGEDTGDKIGVRVMFVCHICNKTYDKEYEEVHMKSHTEEQNYDCEICNRKFYTKTNLEMHMRVHSNGKKFTCSYCKKAFLNYENLQNHVKHLCQSRPYECQYCGRRFMRPHEKVKHERIHTGEKPHVCEICGKAFRVSYCLTLHMRTHSGARPYQCNHCGKRFKAHSVYNHHLLTHSTARNYKCPYCPKAFKTGVQLAGHKNSHIKPFTCTECNRPFASLYAVRAHMETHKRENNLKYSCCLCGASYARSFALRDHIKEHHAGETVEVFEMDKGLMETESEYEMVSEGLNASNMILKDEEATNDVLVVLDETMENVEMVEEVAT
nr:zinc finger protein 585B-like [Onthophagus taurus]XP_022900318.1 zinc finger protein 585B-like [Onthophagus taurus]